MPSTGPAIRKPKFFTIFNIAVFFIIALTKGLTWNNSLNEGELTCHLELEFKVLVIA